MRRSLLLRLLLAVALIALLPVPIVRAADVETVITLNPITTPIYRGDVAIYGGDITQGAPGDVIVEWSTDGSTWQTLGLAPIAGNPSWERSQYIGGQIPLGTLSIRAHYAGGSGFLEAFSEPRTQEVLIHQATISMLGIDPAESAILPGTYPVHLFGAGSAPTSLQQWIDGAWVRLDGPTAGPHTTTIGPLGEGEHKFRAHIETTDEYLGADRELTVTVSKGWSQPTWDFDLTVQANHALPARVGVTTNIHGRPTDAPMTVKDVATDTVIATGNVGMTFTVAPMAVGTHPFLVSYAGNSDYAASSKIFNVIVAADVVDASAVGRNYSTFYPVKDGYRDVVTISGNRNEPISVVIRVYTPSGGVAAGTSIPSATGAYQFVWNGRTSSGSLRPAGKYKIVQTLKDAAGTTQAFTSYVNLSHKRLVTKTSYVTKAGSSVSAGGDPGSGSITISKTGGYVRLTAKYPSGWVGVGYQFAVPAAIVYKAVAFQVYAKGLPTSPPTFIGIQNFITCPYSSTWYEGCFDHWKAIGHSPLALTWFSTSGSASANRHARTVRGMVSAYSGTHTIYKVRVKVTYQILQ